MSAHADTIRPWCALPWSRREQASLHRQLEALDARHDMRLADVAAMSAGRVAQLTARCDRMVAASADEKNVLQKERRDLLRVQSIRLGTGMLLLRPYTEALTAHHTIECFPGPIPERFVRQSDDEVGQS